MPADPRRLVGNKAEKTFLENADAGGASAFFRPKAGVASGRFPNFGTGPVRMADAPPNPLVPF
jgi:hypothetical protein